MALVIKSLTIGTPTQDTSTSASDNFNLIPAGNQYYDLYQVPAGKSTLVKNIRLANTGTSVVKVNLYYNKPNSSQLNRRRQISPVDLAISPGSVYVDNDEVTLDQGDRIQAKADTGGVIQYLISGMERDV